MLSCPEDLYTVSMVKPRGCRDIDYIDVRIGQQFFWGRPGATPVAVRFFSSNALVAGRHTHELRGSASR
jgi:hypothetical protein